MANKLTVGQVLFDSSLQEYTVSKIGKKYFQCENSRFKFEIETLLSVSDFKRFPLHTDKQALMDSQESSKLADAIRPFFPAYNAPKIPLETLRQIHELLTK